MGLDDEGILELMTVVDLFSGLNKFNAGLQVPPYKDAHRICCTLHSVFPCS